jgi:hypothetical protein
MEIKPAKWGALHQERVRDVAGVLYDYKMLTLDQILWMSGVRLNATRLSKLLRESGYARDRQHKLMRYYDGKWHTCNRLHVWQLTTWGVQQWEKYAYLANWGYSSGNLGAYRVQNTDRVIQLGDIHASLIKNGVGQDVEFWSVPRLLNQLGAWHAYRNQENSDMAKLWMERPTLAGGYSLSRNFNEFVLVGLYTKNILGFMNYIQRSFPDSLCIGNRICVYVGQPMYHEALQQLKNHRITKGGLMLLSYEWAIDHPKWLIEILGWNRECVLSPYLDWVRTRGGRVERLPNASFEWRVVHEDGRVEYVDTTVGNSIGRIYGIVMDRDMGISDDDGPFQRVLYVLNEAEKKLLEGFAKLSFRSLECRIVDWPGGK